MKFIRNKWSSGLITLSWATRVLNTWTEQGQGFIKAISNNEKIVEIALFPDFNDDAEFIVKAVNSHAELLEACKEFVKEIENYKDLDNAYNLAKHAIENAEK